MGLYVGITRGALQNLDAQAPTKIIYIQEISGRAGSPSSGFKVMATLPLHLILQADGVFMETNQIIIE